MTESESKSTEREGQRVIALPPVIAAVALAAGIALELTLGSSFMPAGTGTGTGILLLAAGIAIAGLALWEHRRAGNDPDPRTADAAMISAGIYRYSRNPVYIGYLLVLAGIGAWSDSGWILGMVVPAYLLLRYGVVAREETYLEARFGDTYRDYRKAVRRWL